jgi:hypothetical protein
MRKIILLAAIAVIAATAAVWSIVTFANPKAAFHVQSTEELAPVSPRDHDQTGQNPPGRILGPSVLTFYLAAAGRGQRNVNWFTQRGRRERYKHCPCAIMCSYSV